MAPSLKVAPQDEGHRRSVRGLGGVDGEPAFGGRAIFADIGNLCEGSRGDVGNHFVEDEFLAILAGLHMEDELLAVPLRAGLRRRRKHLAAVRIDVDAPDVLKCALRSVKPDQTKTKEFTGGRVGVVFLLDGKAAGARAEDGVAVSCATVRRKEAALVFFLGDPMARERLEKRLDLRSGLRRRGCLRSGTNGWRKEEQGRDDEGERIVFHEVLSKGVTEKERLEDLRSQGNPRKDGKQDRERRMKGDRGAA